MPLNFALLLALTLAALPAAADPITQFLTQGLGIVGGQEGSPWDGGIVGGGYFSLYPNITNYSQYTRGNCLDSCGIFYSARFSGGSNDGTATVWVPPVDSWVTMNITDLRGYYYGVISYVDGNFWGQDENDYYSFRGTWSTGSATFQGSDVWDYFFGIQNGSWNVPSTPEPTTIALLGSGLLGLIGYGRKRLRV